MSIKWMGMVVAVLLGFGFGWLGNRLVLKLKNAIELRGKPARAQYPIVEGLSALAALIVFLRHPMFDVASFKLQVSSFLFEFFFVLDLIVLAAFDWRWKLLPIEWMIGSTLLFGVWGWFLGNGSAIAVLIGAAIGGLFLGVQVWVSAGTWVGEGDPWMGALIGAALGWPKIGISLYLTYLTGGLVAVFLLVSGLAKRGARLPFAPLLALGAVAALWFGQNIGGWVGQGL